MNEVFARRLRQCRERRRMSRRTLGELCGLSKSAIGRYERGERMPDIEVLGLLCEVFEVSADWMIGKR